MIRAMLAGCLFALAAAAQGGELRGRVVAVMDGDTLAVLDAGRQEHRIRLAEIDAPEKGQPFGQRSKQSLSGLCFGREAVIEDRGYDRYGRAIGRVSCAGIDANAPAARAIPPERRQLPLWPDLERAIPNHLARSSLFAPIAPGRRKQHDRAEIASRDDVKILFTGKQLDMADCDVFMQALYEAHRAPLGERVIIKRGTFLKAIGRSNGKSDYEWLHEAFRRLFLGAIEIEAKRYKIGGTPKSSSLHLVDSFDYDPEADAYFIRFDPRILALFHNKEYALIDWDKRKQLHKRVDMAKWLQNYIASHEPGVHRIGLKLLKEWMDYGSPMNKFKEALGEAMGELERLEIIAGARIEPSSRREAQAVWTKL